MSFFIFEWELKMASSKEDHSETYVQRTQHNSWSTVVVKILVAVDIIAVRCFLRKWISVFLFQTCISILRLSRRNFRDQLDKEVIFMMRYFLEPLTWTLMILEISKNGKELMLSYNYCLEFMFFQTTHFLIFPYNTSFRGNNPMIQMKKLCFWDIK